MRHFVGSDNLLYLSPREASMLISSSALTHLRPPSLHYTAAPGWSKNDGKGLDLETLVELKGSGG